MQDLAGCRLVFESLEDLEEFRKHLRSTNVMRNVDHEHRHPVGKFDYITRPKNTGYRGVHEDLRHFPRGSNRSQKEKKSWDG